MGNAVGIGRIFQPRDLAPKVEEANFDHIVNVSLPNCRRSWVDLITNEIREGQHETSVSFVRVLDANIKSIDASNFLFPMLIRGSKKHCKLHHFVMLRFIFGMKGRSEQTVIKRLMNLGREHARLGVTEYYILMYVAAMKRTFSEYLTHAGNTVSILDWTLLLTYVCRIMTRESYNFVRSSGHHSTCTSSKGPFDTGSLTIEDFNSFQEGDGFESKKLLSPSMINEYEIPKLGFVEDTAVNEGVPPMKNDLVIEELHE